MNSNLETTTGAKRGSSSRTGGEVGEEASSIESILIEFENKKVFEFIRSWVNENKLSNEEKKKREQALNSLQKQHQILRQTVKDELNRYSDDRIETARKKISNVISPEEQYDSDVENFLNTQKEELAEDEILELVNYDEVLQEPIKSSLYDEGDIEHATKSILEKFDKKLLSTESWNEFYDTILNITENPDSCDNLSDLKSIDLTDLKQILTSIKIPEDEFNIEDSKKEQNNTWQYFLKLLQENNEFLKIIQTKHLDLETGPAQEEILLQLPNIFNLALANTKDEKILEQIYETIDGKPLFTQQDKFSEHVEQFQRTKRDKKIEAIINDLNNMKIEQVDEETLTEVEDLIQLVNDLMDEASNKESTELIFEVHSKILDLFEIIDNFLHQPDLDQERKTNLLLSTQKILDFINNQITKRGGEDSDFEKFYGEKKDIDKINYDKLDLIKNKLKEKNIEYMISASQNIPKGKKAELRDYSGWLLSELTADMIDISLSKETADIDFYTGRVELDGGNISSAKDAPGILLQLDDKANISKQKLNEVLLENLKKEIIINNFDIGSKEEGGDKDKFKNLLFKLNEYLNIENGQLIWRKDLTIKNGQIELSQSNQTSRRATFTTGNSTEKARRRASYSNLNIDKKIEGLTRIKGDLILEEGSEGLIPESLQVIEGNLELSNPNQINYLPNGVTIQGDVLIDNLTEYQVRNFETGELSLEEENEKEVKEAINKIIMMANDANCEVGEVRGTIKSRDNHN